MTSKLEHALMLAMDGYYLFPLVENSKIPEANYNWRARSTVDAETIKSWFKDPYMGWEQNPNIGIDCGKSGVYVIDVDTKDGKHGDKTFQELDIDYGFTPTRESRTASGGRHLIYKNVGLRNTASKLGQDIDTRGIGGFIVAPGSEIDGKKYEWINSEEVAPLDGWLEKKLAEYKFKTDTYKGETISEDDPSDIARAIEWLENSAEHAVQGAGGDHTTFATAAKLKEFGISPEKSLELLLEHWNEECSPPWNADDLEVKVYNAQHYAQKATGIASASAEFDADEEPPASAMKTKKKEKPQEDYYFGFEKFDLNAVPHRQFEFGAYAMRKKVSICVAPPGEGKSTLALLMAISKATGRDFLGINTGERGVVAIYNGEDELEEQQRRISAALQHYAIPIEELYSPDVDGEEQHPMLLLRCGETHPMRIAARNQNGELKPKDMQPIIDALIRHKVTMLVVDPFAETHPGTENSNEEMITVGRMYRHIAQQANVAVILVHHTKKLDAASSDGHAGNLDTARGASSLGGIARIVFTFFTMNSKQAKGYDIPEEKRRRYVGLMMAKANMSFADSAVTWFERVGQRIGVTVDDMDGEEVGVLRPIKFTKAGAVGVNDAVRELLNEIEGECLNGTRTVKDVVADLVSTYPMYQGKSEATLDRAIRRMFDDGKKNFAGKHGTVELIEIPSTKTRGPRLVAALRVTPFAEISEECEDEESLF